MREQIDDFEDFGEGGPPHVAGPLIGGGVAQVGMLAAKMLFKGKPAAKWAGAIGTLLGAGVSALLMARPGTRATGLSGLVTAALVGIPRQVEDLVAPGGLSDYLGIVTAEQEMRDYLAQQEQPVQMLDSGMGVVTAEQEMSGFGQDEGTQGPPVEMMGGAGFGHTFLS